LWFTCPLAVEFDVGFFGWYTFGEGSASESRNLREVEKESE
jgi:hypothetical protein